MKTGKRIPIAAAAIIFAVMLLAMTACGESSFEKLVSYLEKHSTAAADSGYVAVSVKSDGADLSAMYYADKNELVFGLRKKTDGATEALMLSLGKDSDICTLMFTRQSDVNDAADYAAIGNMMLADSECTKLLIASGEDKGETDLSMVGTVNYYLADLIAGADTYLLAGAGLRMSDLGFVY